MSLEQLEGRLGALKAGRMVGLANTSNFKMSPGARLFLTREANRYQTELARQNLGQRERKVLEELVSTIDQALSRPSSPLAPMAPMLGGKQTKRKTSKKHPKRKSQKSRKSLKARKH
jgi:hypothetical protein